MSTDKGHRPLYIIANDIRKDWERPYFGAVPYIEAMRQVSGISDTYGMDDADMIVRYFLGNANTWRGPVARAIKTELKGMLT